MNTRWVVGVRAVARFTVFHAEHGVLGLVLLLFVLFAIQASRRQMLAWTPGDLAKAAELAQAHVQATRPPHIPVVRYARIAHESLRPVSEASYALFTPFHAPHWRTRKRESPEVYPVRQLVAWAGRGAFAVAADDSAETHATQATRGQRWVCLLGVLDHHRQTEAFIDALWQSPYRDLRRDTPDYVYFRVERAQVDLRDPDAELSWIRQDVRRMYRRCEAWARDGGELVNSRFVPPDRSGICLAFPLGPLEDRRWGPEVCHPLIALLPAALPGHAMAPAIAKGGHDGLAGPAGSGGPEYLLFRYFDYSAEPGKQYRYRVRLLLANPNYGVPSHRLDDEGSAASRYLESDWSEPTAMVEVPEDTQVLVGAARESGPRATVLMTRFLAASGETAFEEFPVRPGQMLDFPGRMLPPPPDSDRVPARLVTTRGMSPQPSSTAGTDDRFRNRTAAATRDLPPGARTVDYTSGALVLDVRGGQRMSGRNRLPEPVSLLVMDRHGSLVVRNELDDPSALDSDNGPVGRPKASTVASIKTRVDRP